MGLFGFKKKNNINERNSNQNGFEQQGGFTTPQGFNIEEGFERPLTLSKEEEITLTKIDQRTEKIDNMLPQLLGLAGLGSAAFLLSYLAKKNKQGQNTQGSRVAVVMDVSGSFENEYNNGSIQSVFERLLPIALQFDDDGLMETWLFSNRAKQVLPVTRENCFGYVEREILNNKNSDVLWGGTNYAPPMELVFNHFVKKNPSKVPTFVIFVTDGQNFDEEKTSKLLREYSKHNIFWQFVGVGSAKMPFLEELDNLDRRYIDNANFMRIKNINQISDEDLYKNLLVEYPSYLSLAQQYGLI